MRKTPWRLQDAKAQFGAAVDAAPGGGAQFVTRRDERVVAVLDVDEYERLRRGERVRAPSFIEHLLAMPRAARTHRRPAQARPAIRLREVVLE